MRILMANKYLYPRAGAETYMLSAAAELKARGHEIAFFGMKHPENTNLAPTFTTPQIEFGVRSSALNTFKNLARAASDSLFGKTQQLLDACIASFKPDLIHAHNIYNQLSPALFRKHIHNIPVIMTV